MATSSLYECEVSVTELNDDCLWEIFEHFSISERVDVARVCKRWQSVVREMMEKGVDTIEIREESDKKLFDPRYLMDCDERLFGGFRFDGVNKVIMTFLNNFKFQQLVWLFKQLLNPCKLEFYHTYFSKKAEFDASKVKEIASKLTALDFNYWVDDLDSLAEELFKNANLNEFKVFVENISHENTKRILDSLVDSMPTTLEKLNVDILAETDLEKVIKKLGSLKSLTTQLHFSSPTDGQTFDFYRYYLLPELFLLFKDAPELTSLDLEVMAMSQRSSLNSANVFIDPLRNLRKISLKGFWTSATNFSAAINLLPNLTVLKLSEYYVICSCPEKQSSLLEDESYFHCFSEVVKSISRLKSLIAFESHLECSYSCAIDSFVKSLIDLIKNGNFFKLQKLCLQHSSHNMELLECFVAKAEANPKKTFSVRLVQWDEALDSVAAGQAARQIRTAFLRKPRNFSFVLENYEIQACTSFGNP